MTPRWRSALRITAFAGLAWCGFGLVMVGCQSRFIYHPPRYAPGTLERLHRRIEPLHYRTEEGAQISYWIGPRAGGDPERVWLVCCGNGTAALQWASFWDSRDDPRAAWLLLDYPGYGLNEGAPSPAALHGAADAAVTALAARLGWDAQRLAERLGVVGHSLGAAVALRYAADHPVRRVIALSPFTSMRAMARRTIGPPWHWFLIHNYDNLASLATIAAQRTPPRVAILHGLEDELIPCQMGQALAASQPAFCTFHAIPGADHNGILEVAQDQVGMLLKEK